jgi:hypothetical protein
MRLSKDWALKPIPQELGRRDRRQLESEVRMFRQDWTGWNYFLKELYQASRLRRGNRSM